MILGFKTHHTTVDLEQSSKFLLKNTAIYIQKIRYNVHVMLILLLLNDKNYHYTWQISDFKSLDQCLGFIIPHMHISII